MVVIMEFLDGYTLLDHVLVDPAGIGTVVSAASSSLGDFMGRIHRATHSSLITPDRVKYLTDQFVR
jgi:hypothetical protein